MSGRVRNPLTGALAAMAAHAALSLAMGWGYPSVSVLVCGTIAVASSVAPLVPLRRAIGGMLGLLVLAPTMIPPGFAAAFVLSLLAKLTPLDEDPLLNAAISVPALAILVVHLL